MHEVHKLYKELSLDEVLNFLLVEKKIDDLSVKVVSWVGKLFVVISSIIELSNVGISVIIFELFIVVRMSVVAISSIIELSNVWISVIKFSSIFELFIVVKISVVAISSIIVLSIVGKSVIIFFSVNEVFILGTSVIIFPSVNELCIVWISFNKVDSVFKESVVIIL